MIDKVPMTRGGHAALEVELKKRQSVDRPRIIEQIAEARAHGDLSENAEYHAAKEEQSHNEGRIAELEDKLATFLAIVVLFASLWLARWFGQFELVRLAWATGRPARPVDWTPRTTFGTGRAGRLFSVFANPHSWLYLLFTVVVFPIVAAASTLVVGTALGAGDAFAAAVLVALAGGERLGDALAAGCRCGMLAASAADGWPAPRC